MDKYYQLTCNEQLLQHIQKNLQKLDVRTHKGENLRHAAVALTVVEVDINLDNGDIYSCETINKDAALILTRRSFRLKNHAGQWALPGGRIDEGETPEETALRELEEEVGLTPGKEHIIGHLDDFTTRSGYIMTPVVVWGGSGVKLKPNPAEVSSVHRIPVKEFMRPDAPILEDIPGSKHPALHMPVGFSSIAAPTAALLYQFREVAILGRKTRVAHYEQPFFAWK